MEPKREDNETGTHASQLTLDVDLLVLVVALLACCIGFSTIPYPFCKWGRGWQSEMTSGSCCVALWRCGLYCCGRWIGVDGCVVIFEELMALCFVVECELLDDICEWKRYVTSVSEEDTGD